MDQNNIKDTEKLKNDIISRWEELKEILKIDFDILPVSYDSWIAPLNIHDLKDDILYISVPDYFQSTGIDMVKNKYESAIVVYLERMFNAKLKLKYLLQSQINSGVSSYYNVSENSLDENVDINNDKEALYKTGITKSNLIPGYTFENFVKGNNNEMAYAAALAVADADNIGEVYNPLFLYGRPGIGKTHLMQAIGHHIIKKHPEKNILYVTSESFTNEVVESIRAGDQAMKRFREKYRTIDVILLDDVQFIIGKEKTQEEFFHTFNELYIAGKAIVLTSDRHPKYMETLDERMKSRFDQGLSVDISLPDYETRLAILETKAESKKYKFDKEILDYIATNVIDNVRELEGALNKIILLSTRNGNVTLEAAEEALKEVITPSSMKVITKEIILDSVCKYYNVTKDEIISKKRTSEICTPRHMTMYLCVKYTNTNLKDIGKFLGNRDHATVINGRDKIEDLLKTDEAVRQAMNALIKVINPTS